MSVATRVRPSALIVLMFAGASIGTVLLVNGGLLCPRSPYLAQPAAELRVVESRCVPGQAPSTGKRLSAKKPRTIPRLLRHSKSDGRSSTD